MPNSQIIGEVTVTPSEPRPGESVLVEVHAPGGQRWSDATAPFIRINGVTGGRQYLQFARGGKQHITVIAEKGGNVDRRIVEIIVKSLAGVTLGTPQPNTLVRSEKKMVQKALADLPILQVGKFANEPYRVSFAVGGSRVFPSGLAHDRPFNKKALEADLHMRFRAAELLTATGAQTRRAIAVPPSPSMRLTQTVGSRLRLLPTEAKLLKTRGQTILGAIYLNDATAATILQLPPPSYDVPVYHWDFGDGSTDTSYSSRLDHDYEASLDPTREHQQFHVTLRIQKPGGSVEEVKRTLSIYNAYAICKNQGAIVPRVEQHTFADTEGIAFRGNLKIYNVETFPITLTGQKVRVMSEDTDQPDTLTPLVPISPVTAPANGSIEMSVFVPFSQVPKNSLGFTVYYFGNAPDGKPIRVEAFFDVRARDRVSNAITFGDIALGHLPMMQNLLGTGLAEGRRPLAFSHESTDSGPATTELRSVRNIAGSSTVGHLTRAELNNRVLGHSLTNLDRVERWISAEAPSVLYSLIPAPPPIVGNECDPNNLPDLTEAQIDEGWVCQATPETHEVASPARFLNALKGDIILSPGGNGLIGALLLQVSPPQRYSHSGMMTRNYDQITHSTASEDRLLDHSNGSIFGQPAPSDGFQPNALKYLWPGVITQSIEQAVYGEWMIDPEGGKKYNVKGFTPISEGADIDGHWEIIPPLVIKPDPLMETPQIRAKLRQVANDALVQTGNSHYRFFCYTDPTLGQRAEGVAPSTAGWAAGTYPTVCSSFIWMTLKRQGVHLESANTTVTSADLEVLDVASGAQVGPTTPDGLYLYTAAERLRAADWLKKELARLVTHKLEKDSGILASTIDLFSDMTDDVGNQVVNTFASDWADTAAKDSEEWKNVQDANAVSPDNILLWDSPAALGLYGFAAPLAFRPARLEEVIINRWRKVTTKGRLSGRVWFNGAPVAGAFVQVFDGKTDFTDSGGYYDIPGLPFGHYAVKAWKDNIQSVTASTTVEIDLTQPAQTLEVTLQPPADAYRRIQILARIQTTDDEIWPWDDEHADTQHLREVYVQPWHSHEEVYFEQRMGGEIRIELRFIIDLNLDRSVNVNINAKMYEGTSEDTSDLNDEENSTTFLVAKSQALNGSIRLYNDEFAGGDVSNISFTITNLVQN